MSDPFKKLSDAMSGKPPPKPAPKPDPKTVVTGKVAAPSSGASKDPAVMKAIEEAKARAAKYEAERARSKPKR